MSDKRIFDLKQVFNRAVDISVPEILAKMDSNEPKCTELAIALRIGKEDIPEMKDLRLFGNYLKSGYSYHGRAGKKALMSYREKMATSKILTDEYIHLIRVGDPVSSGGVYFENFDFAVGTDGVGHDADETISQIVGNKMINIMRGSFRALIKSGLDSFEPITI